MSSGDQKLFPVSNAFFLGAFQTAINEGQRLSDGDLGGSGSAATVERDFYVYRSYLELGQGQIILDEVDSEAAPQALLAVRLFASLTLGKISQEEALSTLEHWTQSGDGISSNANFLTMVGVLYNFLGNHDEALKSLSACLNLEMTALMIETLIKIDRPDAAEKVLRKMTDMEDDATLTQLAQAWVCMAQSSGKTQEAFYIFQELGEKYQWTSRLTNGSAACQMQLGRFEDAERDLMDALSKDAKDPETVANLAVCCTHLGKPSSRYLAQLKTLSPSHLMVSRLATAEDLFEKSATAYA